MILNYRKLILFGLLKGILRKLNKYPMSLTDINQAATNPSSKKYFNGYHNYDKLCSVFGELKKTYFATIILNISVLKKGLSVKALEEQLDEDTNVAVCIKWLKNKYWKPIFKLFAIRYSKNFKIFKIIVALSIKLKT